MDSAKLVLDKRRHCQNDISVLWGAAPFPSQEDLTRIYFQRSCIIKYCFYVGSWQGEHKIALRQIHGSKTKSCGKAGERNKTIFHILVM